MSDNSEDGEAAPYSPSMSSTRTTTIVRFGLYNHLIECA